MYQVEHGYPKESFGPDGLTATVAFRGPWHERYDFISSILGNGGLIYPYSPAMRSRAKTAVPEPQGQSHVDSNGFMAYEQALITVTFEPPGRYTPETEDLINESVEPTTEFMTLDPADFRWSSSNDRVEDGEAPGRLVYGFDYIVAQYHVQYLPNAILSLAGCVNSAPFRTWTMGWIFAPETLLYRPPTITRKITTDGAEGWQLIHRLSYRSTGWNRWWRTKTQKYESFLLKDGSEYKNYPLADFSLLFAIR